MFVVSDEPEKRKTIISLLKKGIPIIFLDEFSSHNDFDDDFMGEIAIVNENNCAYALRVGDEISFKVIQDRPDLCEMITAANTFNSGCIDVFVKDEEGKKEGEKEENWTRVGYISDDHISRAMYQGMFVEKGIDMKLIKCRECLGEAINALVVLKELEVKEE